MNGVYYTVALSSYVWAVWARWTYRERPLLHIEFTTKDNTSVLHCSIPKIPHQTLIIRGYTNIETDIGAAKPKPATASWGRFSSSTSPLLSTLSTHAPDPHHRSASRQRCLDACLTAAQTLPSNLRYRDEATMQSSHQRNPIPTQLLCLADAQRSCNSPTGWLDREDSLGPWEKMRLVG